MTLVQSSNPDALLVFVNEAQPLDMFMYYRGYNLSDYILAREIRGLAYKLAQKGLVYLVQRRFVGHPHMFDYLAIKASKMPVRSLIPISNEKWKEKYRQQPLTYNDSAILETIHASL